ncbi:MAG: 6-phosphogluconolactonase [Acidobacteria bacterium]|nr:6-phosphogluconolactonase [Acidobacteriota bacterium]
MRRPEVQTFPDLEQLSIAAAKRFVDLARGQVDKVGSFSAALSGGSTSKRLYELLAAPPYSTQISWEDVHLFQVDERCVPPDDPQSNYRMIRESLLRHVPVPEMNFHRMAAEQADRSDAATQYAAEIARILPPDRHGLPRFDLMLLGMGSDGHTASLFPASPALGEESLWVSPNFVQKLGMYRLTLTFPVLNAARQIVFLVSGAEKAETLRRVLQSDAGLEPLPAQRIRPFEGELSWFVDRAAARILEDQLG